ncbi:MAG: DmsE family decaheme c-type cytochrome [Xanthomonadales bacterium]|nr:DmsE family decaheme c-type cytochrome [Xanthomonadales bacterium]
MRVFSLFVVLMGCLAIGLAGLLSEPRDAVAQEMPAAAPVAVAHPASGPTTKLTQSDIERMLPATDMGAGAATPAGHPGFAAADVSPATPFDGALIPVNPLAPDADAVGAKTCVACHAQENIQASHSLHVASFRAGAGNTGPQAACEACHGPGSVHAKDPTKPGSIIAFTHDAKTPPAVQAGVCLSCHAGGARQHWTGSVHQNRGLSCTDCHNPMAKLSPEGVLAKSSINEVCSTCHQDIRAKFNRRSHMPLPEGQMACTDCHNPHGSITKPLLKTDTVNETCYGCHAEKRGPFLFEHAPVRANCLNCHDVHGSNQQTLLVAPIPMLCQQCHTMTRHPNDLQTAAGLGTGPHPDERIMGRGCLSCHTNIHGSNNPSGPKFHK